MPHSSFHDQDPDIALIRELIRMVVIHVRQALDCNLREKDEVITRRLKYYELLFGPKASLVSVLETLTGLIIRLQDVATEGSRQTTTANEADELSPSDLSLAEAYIRRIKQSGLP